MAVSLPIGFNFRGSEAYVTDLSPDVFIKAANDGSSPDYAASPGYGFTGESSVFGTNRDSGINARLAGIMFIAGSSDPSNAEFRIDTGSGGFLARMAIGDAGNAHTNYRVQLFDGSNTTAIATVSGSSVAEDQWVDATGVTRTSASDWVSNNAALSITLANDYLRVRVGTGPTGSGDYTCLSHFSIDAAAAPPIAPSGVTVGSVTPFGATVLWTDNSADETGFIVRYAVSPYTSFTTASTTASTNAVSYVLSGLTDNTPYKADVAARNANGTSTAVVSGTFTTLALTRLRTNADTSKGVWTASTGTALYAMIDEASFSDADYITAASASTCKLKFENSTDPADDSNHRIAVRARATSGVLTMQLIQGDPAETTIASTAITASTAFAEYGLTLTTAQAATITDYADLYVKLISS